MKEIQNIIYSEINRNTVRDIISEAVSNHKICYIQCDDYIPSSPFEEPLDLAISDTTAHFYQIKIEAKETIIKDVLSLMMRSFTAKLTYGIQSLEERNKIVFIVVL